MSRLRRRLVLLACAPALGALVPPAAVAGQDAGPAPRPSARLVVVQPDAPIHVPGFPDDPLVEPRPAVHPTDPDHVVVAAIARAPDGSRWRCVALATRDGGRSWRRRDFGDDPRCIDPWVTILDDGTVLVTTTEIRRDAEGDDRFALVLHRSPDGGDTWEEPTELGRSWEHVMTVAGSAPGTVHLAGRVTTATATGTPRHAVAYYRSLDAGRSFVERFRLTTGPRSVMPTGIHPTRDGRVVLTWRDAGRDLEHGAELPDSAGAAWALTLDPEGGRPLEHRLVDRGCTTGAGEGAFPGYPSTGAPPATDRETPGRPPVAHVCLRPGPGGVSFAATAGPGREWSPPRRIDGAGPDAHLRTPMVALSREGAVLAAWYDRTDDPRRACQWVRAVAAAAPDARFTPPVRVSTAPSCPAGDGNGVVARSWEAGGDYGSLVPRPDGAFLLVWADSRDGAFRLRHAVLRVGSG